MNPGCKVFAVGDDWQSIYRFTGSDIGLFTQFENFFGATEKSKIETTYRYNNPLIELSSDFIMANPNQEKKQVKGFFDKKTNYLFYYYHSYLPNQGKNTIRENLKRVLPNLPNYRQLDEKGFEQNLRQIENAIAPLENIYLALDDLLDEESILDKKVAMIGRYNFDLDNLLGRNEELKALSQKDAFFTPFAPRLEQTKNDRDKIIYQSYKGKLEISFLTAHKSKGLEYDIVIIINTKTGEYGFPSQITDDEILNMLLHQSDQYPHSEERRLFYVAMTRCKEKVIFLVDENSKSRFIHEIEMNYQERDEQSNKQDNERLEIKNKKCPECKNQDLMKTKIWQIGNKSYQKDICKNARYGCDYQKKILINDGVFKKDKRGIYFKLGKYVNQNIIEVASRDKKYLEWWLEQELTEESEKSIRGVLGKRVASRKN